MKRFYALTAATIIFLSFLMVMSGCSGSGKGGSTGIPSGTTVVTGKVTLSGSVASSLKPGLVAFNSSLNAGKAQSGNVINNFIPGTELSKVLEAAGAPSEPLALANATVELYDADHPEWIYPVAISLSDAQGNYDLSVLANADENNASYVNGDPIPAGYYTVIASKFNTNVGKLFVGVQAVVKKFSGAVTGNDLQAPDSDAVPRVAFMFGKSSNLDGNFGGINQQVATNAAIPITFSMPMARLRAIEAISITNVTDGSVITGKFKISPDLLTVTFAPDTPWTIGNTYSIKLLGGKSPKAAKNIYGIPIPATVYGRFVASASDDTPSTVYPISPATTTNVPIITPIRIASTEPLDVNTFTITSDPGIGDKPFIRYVGYFKMSIGNTVIDSFVYEIVPSVPVQINTNYQIKVSDARDMAGNPLPPTPITFKTEATSAGITATDVATRNKQLAVKDVYGKWMNALNSRNTSMLTAYMTGDFFWLSPGNSRDDVNRDGRLSLNEFTSMLENWFLDLDRCGSAVTGDIVDDLANPNDGINITGSKANITFSLTATPSNTMDPSCTQQPPQTLYAELANLNSGWFMIHGSDKQVTIFPSNLRSIELIAPNNGTSFPEPTQQKPLLPEFSWLGVPDVNTYALIIVDTKSRGWQTGWVGLVDGTSSADQTIKAKYSPSGGYRGNVYVVGAHPAFGFNQNLEFKAGGTYYWAVLGLKDIDINMIQMIYEADIKPYLIASSGSFNIDVQGAWKELVVTVKDANGTTYPYLEEIDGFNVNDANSVTVTVTSPDNTGGLGTGYYNISGSQTWQSGAITFNSNGQGSFTATLSSKQNRMYVQDRQGNPLYKQFSIYTTGGTPPKILLPTITPKDCNGQPSQSWTASPWGSYNSTDVCSVDISGFVLDASITQVYVNVSGQYGSYNTFSNPTTVGIDGSFTLTDVPVYNGWNRVEVYDLNNYQNVNYFTVQTSAGTPIQPGVLVSSVTGSDGGTIRETTRSRYEIYFDAGTETGITVSGTAYTSSGCPACTANYYHNVPPNWQAQATGVLTTDSAGAFTQAFTLVTGWNVINLSGPMGGIRLLVFTKGGVSLQLPHVITKIADDVNTAGIVPLVASGYYRYDAGASCSVTIMGQTNVSNQGWLYMISTNSAGQGYYEYKPLNMVQDVGDPTKYNYSITKNVYFGTNTMDLYDGQSVWRGVQVSTSCPNVPVSLKVTSVSDGVAALTSNAYGQYKTDSQIITIRGTAKAGKVVSAYIGGAVKTTTAFAGDIFVLDVPISAGWNYFSLGDGSTSESIYIFSAYGTVYKAPFTAVRVEGVAASTGGLDTDSWGNWSVTTASVTITAKSPYYQMSYAQKGSYNSNTGSASQISWDGTRYDFSFSIPLDQGVNYVTLSDGNGGSFYMTITTTTGATASTQLVMITTPANGAEGTAFTVSGTVDTVNFGAKVGTVYAYVYDYALGGVYYSSNPDDVKNLGYRPLTYSSGTFLFSMNAYSTDYKVQVQVYAFDTTGTISHGHSIWLNPAGYPSGISTGSSYFKLGAAATVNDVFLRQADFLRSLMKR